MPNITVYSQPSCPDCNRAKMMLYRSKLPFQEVNVRNDEDAFAMLMDAGFKVSPVIYLDDEPLGTITDLEMALRSGELLRRMAGPVNQDDGG